MQKVQLRANDTKRDAAVRPPLPTEHDTGLGDDGAAKRPARKLALILMAASSLLTIGLILVLWLLLGSLL